MDGPTVIWTPELEAARLALCAFMLEHADDPHTLAVHVDLGRRMKEVEQALTILGEIAHRQLFTNDDVHAELNAFYDRACNERGFPRDRASILTAAFVRGLLEDGKWPSIVLKDLGLQPFQAYRRVAPPKDPRS